MSFFKNLRLQFTGELHEIYLINFSVDAAELQDLIPAPIRPRITNGRAMISMVDVRLMHMHAESRWIPFDFHYQHIGFRVLVEDAAWNADHVNHGIYFLRSFTDRPGIARAGNMFANYRLETAHLVNYPSGLLMQAGDRFLEYRLVDPIFAPDAKSDALKARIGAIDRAWAVEGKELQKTQIMREKWPLQAMNCFRFRTNFFESAHLEGVFRVPETIHYTWLPAETVETIPSEILHQIPALSYV